MKCKHTSSNQIIVIRTKILIIILININDLICIKLNCRYTFYKFYIYIKKNVVFRVNQQYLNKLSLFFINHNERIICKALLFWGFIRRNSSNFDQANNCYLT